jgi:chromosome segregation ATPase
VVEKPTDWQASYKGLQTAYNKQQASLAALQAKFDELNEKYAEVDQAGKLYSAEKQTLQGQIAEMQSAVNALTAEKARVEGTLARQKLVMSDYPDLAQFEAAGLTPQAESLEELKAKMEQFRVLLKNQSAADMSRVMAGAVPSGTPAAHSDTSEEAESEDYLWSKVSEHAGDFNRTEFEKYRSRLDALLARRRKS